MVSHATQITTYAMHSNSQLYKDCTHCMHDILRALNMKIIFAVIMGHYGWSEHLAYGYGLCNEVWHSAAERAQECGTNASRVYNEQCI